LNCTGTIIESYVFATKMPTAILLWFRAKEVSVDFAFDCPPKERRTVNTENLSI